MFDNIKYVSSGKFVSRGEWIHPSRVIDSYEVIFMLEGSIFINENGIEYELGPKDALLLEPGLKHFGFKESQNVCFYWLHFTGAKPDINKLTSVNNHYHISLLFSQLLHFSSFNDGLSEGNDYLARLVLIELHRSGRDTNGNSLANRIAEWIRVNSDRNIKVQDVAARFGYNADYLNRVFRKIYGQSVKAYIAESKMQHIKKLLMTTEYPLSSVAEMSGFSEYKYFLKFFKYHENMTPTEFVNTYFRTHINIK